MTRGFAYIAAYIAPWCVLAGLLSFALSAPARARAEENPFDAWARWVVTPKTWKGQTVLFPDAQARPDAPLRVDSSRLPLHVHAPLGTSEARLALALSALEDAFIAAGAHGWPRPAPDGGYGGTLGFDLYLVADAEAPVTAAIDTPHTPSDFDAALTHARVDLGLPRDELRACVTSAFMQAAFLGEDPSEATAVVRASGELAAWIATGETGCAQSFAQAQARPERGTLSASVDSAAAGALFLAFLSERHDGEAGSLLGALWELTRQRSRGLVAADRLRSSPDLWEVLAHVLEATAHGAFEESFEEFAAARFFSGKEHRAAASYAVFAALPDAAAVPLLADLDERSFPKQVVSTGDGLSLLGSAYVRVRLADAQAIGTLRVWLRAEREAQWSVIAMRLDRDGRELGRMTAPARKLPQSYLPIELSPDTREVILVVTHMPDARPDADRPAPSAHGFSLTIDRTR